MIYVICCFSVITNSYQISYMTGLKGSVPGSGLIRIDLLCFLVRCCKKRLSQHFVILCVS